jgi:hypothetical protein
MKVEVVIRQSRCCEDEKELIIRSAARRTGYVELSLGKETIELASDKLITAINKATI